MDKNFNPYNDKTIHTTQPDIIKEYTDRQGFNDVIKHYDAVNGFQLPKQLNHFPRSLKHIIRWAIILNVGVYIGFIIYQLIKLL
jgi:hypothetical protein